MTETNTLKVRNLPPDLSNFEKQDLLKHFGALEVKCIGTKNPTAFAKFESAEAARKALRRLHQLEVLGYNLDVVYAKPQKNEAGVVEVDVKQRSVVSGLAEKEEDGSKRYEKFLQKLNAWSLGLDLSEPPPAHLNYQYPPPNVQVLANIARAMCAVPKFYTQVLHLMNKMNLPSPFHQTCEEHSQAIARMLGQQVIQDQFTEVEPQETMTQELEMQLGSSTSESELESDGAEEPRLKEIIPERRPKTQKKAMKRPRLQVQQAGKTAHKSELSLEQVFDVAARPEQRKIELKLRSEETREETQVSEQEAEPGFGILFPQIPEQVPQDTQSKEEDLDGSYIAISQFKANRIPERDRQVLSVFRGYQAGAPSCRLYIKNLAKTVTTRDLHFLFRAFLGHKPTDEEVNQMFDIRLMTEGRMKGQAFVTYPSVSQAQSALHETNGYILKDKPMVVQFARSAKTASQ